MRWVLVTLALGLLSLGAYGHHGWGSYDQKNLITFNAKLDQVEWTNPHPIIYVIQDGKRAAIYLPSISRAIDRGVQQQTLAIGKTVTIEAYRSMVNPDEYRAERITVDNKTVELH